MFPTGFLPSVFPYFPTDFFQEEFEMVASIPIAATVYGPQPFATIYGPNPAVTIGGT